VEGGLSFKSLSLLVGDFVGVDVVVSDRQCAGKKNPRLNYLKIYPAL
jgi:hypothetical protein